MAFLGVADFVLIHEATPYGVGAAGAYSVAGTAFPVRLCVLSRGGSMSGIGGQRAEMTTRRQLLFNPDFDLEALGDVQFKVEDEAGDVLEQTGDLWSREGQVETVYGPDRTPEYRRCEVLRVEPSV